MRSRLRHLRHIWCLVTRQEALVFATKYDGQWMHWFPSVQKETHVIAYDLPHGIGCETCGEYLGEVSTTHG